MHPHDHHHQYPNHQPLIENLNRLRPQNRKKAARVNKYNGTVLSLHMNLDFRLFYTLMNIYF